MAKKTSRSKTKPKSKTKTKPKPKPKVAKAKKLEAGSGHDSVSNVPEDAERAVTGRSVTKPVTEGIDRDKANPGAEGLESVQGHNRAGAQVGLESAAPRTRALKQFKPPESGELHDIGEASFGPPPPVRETVHGPDDRVRINNTGEYPWRAIASLVITAKDNSTWIGTGWFISPRTLITAGHCVYIKGSGIPGRDGWVKKISVMPGRNTSSLPFGSVTSTVFRTVSGWIKTGGENFDYAAILLPTPLGDTVGVFGIGVFPDNELTGQKVNISGYPGDKPSGEQWFDAKEVAQVNANKVFYDIDTAGGQSGAPVFRVVNGKRIGVAVHAYGGNSTNSGTRINAKVHARMTSWMS